MLWHISGTTLHILGAVHAADSPLTLRSESIRQLDIADVFAFETNFEEAGGPRGQRFGKGVSLGDVISPELLQDTRELWAKLNLPQEELETTRPWAVTHRLTHALMPRYEFDFAHGIDREVLGRAKQSGRKLFFLESNEAGRAPLTEAPIAEQEVSLAKLVRRPDEFFGVVQAIVAAWRAGKPGDLESIVQNWLNEAPVTCKAMLAKRNKAWLAHLLRHARSGKKVVAIVGVLHMVGPDSLPILLKSKGLDCSLV